MVVRLHNGLRFRLDLECTDRVSASGEVILIGLLTARPFVCDPCGDWSPISLRQGDRTPLVRSCPGELEPPKSTLLRAQDLSDAGELTLLMSLSTFGGERWPFNASFPAGVSRSVAYASGDFVRSTTRFPAEGGGKLPRSPGG